MKKRLQLSCFALSILLISCASVKTENYRTADAVQNDSFIEEIESRFVFIDSGKLASSEDKKRLIDDINAQLVSSEIKKNRKARLLAVKGLVLLADGYPEKARTCCAGALSLNKNDPRAVILNSRLGAETDFEMQESASDNAQLLVLEEALNSFAAGKYKKSVASFDSAFISLPLFYRTAYQEQRNSAWKLKDTENTGSALNSALLKTSVTLGDMLQITQQETDTLQNYTDGKQNTASELFKKISAEGLFRSCSNAEPTINKKLKSGTKLTRLLCARFIWNLYVARKNNSAIAVKYSVKYRARADAVSPVADIPLDSPDFDAVLGCVENEFMTLPDGKNFRPDEPVPAADFLSYIKAMK